MKMNDLTQLRSLKHMLDYAAENFGDDPFVTYNVPGGMRSRTYNEFKACADAFSRFIDDKGLTGSHVAVIGPNSFEWIVTYFGTVDSGSVIVPLGTAETPDMLCSLVDFADVDVLVFDKGRTSLYGMVRDRFPRVRTFISLDNCSDSADVINIDDIFTQYKGSYDKEPDGSSMSTIVFTSGTTGFPKGVMLSHKNLIYSATSVHVACPTHTLFCILPMSHAFCFTADVTKGIVSGKNIFINDSIQNIMQNVRAFKPDSIIAVPQIVKKLMFGALKFAQSKPELTEQQAVKAFFGGNIIDIICGGAPLEASLAIRFAATGVPVLNGYGMTECAPIISNNATFCSRPGSIGKPIPCMQVKIEDGQILVKGPSVMIGYYKNEQETKEVFTDDGWFKTGDIGHFDDDGFLYLTGRCKNLILLDNGENISAEMLEARFAMEPLVKEVVCYGDSGAVCAEIFPDAAYAEEHNIKDVSAEMISLLQRVNSGLAAFQRISKYVVRDRPFARTSSAKIKREDHHEKITKPPVAPVTATERKVCGAVRDLLLLDNIGTDDNFFAVGGDSLSAIELAVTLNVSQQLIYDNPFLGLLSAAIDRENAKAAVRDKLDVNELITSTAEPDVKLSGFKTAFLTGATGFLGSHILRELVNAGLEVICLVRDTERFKKLMNYYFGVDGFEHVTLVTGDVEKACLGLTPEHYKELTQKVDIVFHTAANVHHAGDYSDFERTNVGGTVNVIKFARDANAVLEHTSTVSLHGAATVIEKHKHASFDETVLNIGQHYADNVYIHSKYCAEEQILLARKEGLHANIFRMGNLTWRTGDGLFQENSADNGFLHRVRAMLKLGIYNDNMDKYPMDLTPVDEAAKAYVSIALLGHVNEIYHIYDPNYLPVKDMFRFLDVPFCEVSTAETIETVMANSSDRDIRVFMFYSLISGRSENVEMKCERTLARLSETGFVWSVPDRAYLMAHGGAGCQKGNCLDFDPYKPLPMRTSGGEMTYIQKLTLGVLRDAVIRDSALISGAGALEKLYSVLSGNGVTRPLIVTFPGALKNKEIASFVSSFRPAPPVFDSIAGEPSVTDTQRALDVYCSAGCGGVVGIGGGSVLDISKIIALRAANPGESIDDICKLDSDARQCVPFFAVPTTSGTGSEVTVFAVITQEDDSKKKPFASVKFLPDTVVLDPLLTLTVPKRTTAFTGIDALSHAVESYICAFGPSFPSDRDHAPDAVKKIFNYLQTACADPGNVEARTALQTAAYEAGISFRRIGTGYVHAIAHRLGEFYHVPHGLAIAAAFAPVLRASMPYGAAGLSALASACGFADKNDGDEKNADVFIDEIEKLISSVGIDVKSIPFRADDLPEIVRRAQDEAKMTGYPRPFSDEKLAQIIKGIFA